MPVSTPTPETTLTSPSATALQHAEEDHLAVIRAQQKLDKFVKAAKKEDNLSPGFQNMVHAEMKRDSKESTRNMHSAVTALDKAKQSLIDVESARAQLWSQWKTFLQNSVVKWKEHTASFQASETAFQVQIQEATVNLKRAQRRLDYAKKRVDAEADDAEDNTTVISDEETEEMDQTEQEVPKDENAIRIQEGLQQVVSSLEELSESAERLEPKAKRPRQEAGDGSKLPPSMRPFGQADAS